MARPAGSGQSHPLPRLLVMPDSIGQTKARLRGHLRHVLKQLGPEERAENSRRLCLRLPQMDVWQKARRLLLFAPLASEPDIWPLAELAIAQQKVVALPRFKSPEQGYQAARIDDLRHNLALGHHGIREPALACPAWPLNELDLVLVPALGLDPSGRRLGRGKGYYDRLLAVTSGVKCGIVFDSQVRPAIPAEAHDTQLDCILTPTRWFVC
jgi:5-formyltetrahydrofolate cyclo-ligase